ncbi:hypothetical protein [Bacillus atrophaeus]|uniref:hypothetical protein n=1 Tax=Bacillus atrophaeus TaxID=1452 RepID=UPI00123A525B|nr:hypothetical protein [Bacillus atrophaeus]KAA6455263.1 hypothetical protein DX926_04310 [Bacillus atrophaeus]
MSKSSKLLAHEFAIAVVASTPSRDETAELIAQNKLKLYLESVKQFEQMADEQKVDWNEFYKSDKFSF